MPDWWKVWLGLQHHFGVIATLRKTAPQVVASLHESKQKSSWNCLEFKIINVGQTHWAANRLLFTYFPHQWSSGWRYRQTLAQHQTWTLLTSVENWKMKFNFMHPRHYYWYHAYLVTIAPWPAPLANMRVNIVNDPMENGRLALMETKWKDSCCVEPVEAFLTVVKFDHLETNGKLKRRNTKKNTW